MVALTVMSGKAAVALPRPSLTVNRPLCGGVQRRDDHHALTAQHFTHQLARRATGLHQILPDERQALTGWIIGVEGHDRDARFQGFVDHWSQRVRAH